MYCFLHKQLLLQSKIKSEGKTIFETKSICLENIWINDSIYLFVLLQGVCQTIERGKKFSLNLITNILITPKIFHFATLGNGHRN